MVQHFLNGGIMGRKIIKEDDDIIYDLYLNEMMSSTEIGKKIGVSHKSVLNHLEAMGVKRRSLEESHFSKNKKVIPPEFYDYEIMYDLYVTQHMTKEQIGDMFDCAPHVIHRVLKKLGIHVRGTSEAKIGVQVGESHHNWKGGVSNLNSRCRQYYQSNISPKIRARDHYTCQMCGSHSNLHTHHIIPFSVIVDEICKEHADLDAEKDVNELYQIIVEDSRFLDESNLITYCKECHLGIIHGYFKTIRSETS